MELQPQRRFSLDKVDVDPKILNKILSADGDETLGEWDGNSIDDLVKELDRIEEFSGVRYSALPHSKYIPEDFKNEVEKDYPVWACDRLGNCLVGEQGDQVKHVEKIRKHYEKKYGGVGQYKEKIKKEIEERGTKLWQK